MTSDCARIHAGLPDGESTSGKSAVFGTAYRRFESSLPSHFPGRH